jgi:molybdopterin/thiamine biosynthesis adenylyltransferase
MIDLAKSYDFFQPELLTHRIHIIGCGAIGSTVAEQLVRFGITNLNLYDFDIVESHNIANQMFRSVDIGKLKTEALMDYLSEINPDIQKDARVFNDGWNGQRLSGYVFLCVDSIDLRREIAEKYANSSSIKGMFDFRMRLEDAQHYAADWKSQEMIRAFINSMNFTEEEAKASTPVSACNLPLSVNPTVKMICAYGVANFINFVKGKGLKKLILADAFNYTVDAF